jgi:hypothetical protein
MPPRTIEVNDERWSVTPTGRRTQYSKDEFSVLFTRVAGGPHEERAARYSPLGVKEREASLAGLTEAQLSDLLRRSQPSWTTPELGYRR